MRVPSSWTRSYERAFVLTTDFRDFSADRVPFASPEVLFTFEQR